MHISHGGWVHDIRIHVKCGLKTFHINIFCSHLNSFDVINE